MTTDTRKFHLNQILSITTGVLLQKPSTQYPIDGVYEILNFMTSDDLFTHAIPRAADECKPYLLEQFPQLVHITEHDLLPFGKVTGTKRCMAIAQGYAEQFGEWFDVRPIHREDHQVIDPFVEFAMLAPHAEQISIEVDEQGNFHVDSDEKE